MKTTIEYSRMMRKYFFFPDPKRRDHCIVDTNKTRIERAARKAGFDEIEYRNRSTVADLMRYGHYTREDAKRAAEMYR